MRIEERSEFAVDVRSIVNVSTFMYYIMDIRRIINHEIHEDIE